MQAATSCYNLVLQTPPPREFFLPAPTHQMFPTTLLLLTWTSQKETHFVFVISKTVFWACFLCYQTECFVVLLRRESLSVFLQSWQLHFVVRLRGSWICFN